MGENSFLHAMSVARLCCKANTLSLRNLLINKRYKQKNENSFEFSLWCHQKMSSISKWLYIFALKNRNKRNLPLLLHLNSAPFCSVSQSRVPTLMQRYIIIVIYKWELQSYFFIISSIRHFTASSKPFLIPCDNP